ncbi:TPA: phage tail tape measure protein [Klebsiella oxytoca]
MATLRELVIKISANSQSFQSEISRASRMGENYYKTMQQGGKQAAASSRETQKALASVTAQLNETKAAAVSLAGSMAGVFATSQLIQYADTWNMMNGRLKLASVSADDFADAQRNLYEISQRTGTSLEANTQLYSRVAQSMRDAGYASGDIARVTETVATSLKLSGAGIAETSSVITQLSQALGSGVLRGEEFNSIMENGGRLARLLADGLGTSIGGLRAMANAGQLTTDKLIPVLTNVDILRKEFEQLAPTISGSTQKVENAFMAWVGGADKASGASAALAGGLDSLAENIDNVATAAGVLIALGLSRQIGTWTSAIKSNTGEVLKNYQAQVSDIAAKQQAALVLRKKAAADSAAAIAAYELAKGEAAAAKGTDAATVATQKLIAKRSEMIKANASLVLSNKAVAASEAQLGKLTSASNLAMAGAKGLVGLVGGLPGVLMLGAGAWYTMYQNTQQARKEAQEYARTIDEVRDKASKMSLPEVDSTRSKTVEALQEQNRLIEEQEKSVQKLKKRIEELNSARNKPGITQENELNILKAISIVEGQIAVEEGELNHLRSESSRIQEVLAQTERRRNDLIKEQTWKQNAAYQSLLMMNGQHSELNRLLGLGNSLLQQRQGLVNAPMRMPQADLTSQQQDALKKSGQDLELSKLKGRDKESRRLQFAADALGLSSSPEHQTARQKYINDNLQAWDNNEANKPQRKAPKSDADKLVDKYSRILQQQKEQLALAGDNTELAKMKFDISQGELSNLDSQKKEILLQNAALIDQKKIAEQLQSFKDGLADSNAAAKKNGDIDFIGAGMGEKARSRMKEMEEIKSEFADRQRDLQRDFQNNNIDGDLYAQETEALKEALEERLQIQEEYYQKSDEQNADWMGGVNDRLAEYAEEASNYSKMAADATSSIIDGAVSSLSDGVMDILKDTQNLGDGVKNIFAGLGETVIQTLVKMGAQWLVYQGVQLLVEKTSKASASAGLLGEAQAMSLMAQLNAYASTAAIPMVGPAMAPAAMAVAAGVTEPLVGMIASSSLMGMAHDGVDKVPETGTWLLQKGERVVTASTSAKLDSTLEKVQQVKQEQAAAMSGDINITTSFSGKQDDSTVLALESRLRVFAKEIESKLSREVYSPQGVFGNSLKTIYPNRKGR